MNGFALRLVLTQRQKPTRKWAIWYHVYDVIVVSILTSVRHILWKIGVFSKLFVMFCVFQTLQYSLLSLWISEVIYCRITLKKDYKNSSTIAFCLIFWSYTKKVALQVTNLFPLPKQQKGSLKLELIFLLKTLRVCSLIHCIFNAKIRVWSNPRECEHSL